MTFLPNVALHICHTSKWSGFAEMVEAVEQTENPPKSQDVTRAPVYHFQRLMSSLGLLDFPDLWLAYLARLVGVLLQGLR